MSSTFRSSLRGVHLHHRRVTHIYPTLHVSQPSAAPRQCTLHRNLHGYNSRNNTHQRGSRSLLCAAQPAAASAAADDGAEAGTKPSPHLYGDEDAPFLKGRMQRIVRQIAAFGLPALMVPLADPIMSLIDTVALGQMAGSLQLAALGPCALLFNFAFYSFSALSVATVSLIAERIREGQGAEHALSTSLSIGALGGILVGAILLGWGPQLLAMTGCDPALLPLSWQYLQIRALAAPAAIVTQVAQAGLLGQRDSRTPFKIVLVSIFLSLLGDLWLIGGCGMGVAGAAWTTAAAQYLSAGLLLVALQRSRVIPPFELPSRKELSALLVTASALGVYYISKTTSYLFLQASATRLPAMLLAAHQPVWQLWGLASFTNTPLEQAALAFIPAAATVQERREITIVLLSLGALSGIGCSLVAHGIPAFFPGLLTADVGLWTHMQSVWLPGTLSLLACGMDVSSTGVLLACKDVAYVARSMIFSGSALVAFLWWTKAGGGSVVGVWWGLTVFFGARVVQSLPRAVFRHLRPFAKQAQQPEEKDKDVEVEVIEELNLNAT